MAVTPVILIITLLTSGMAAEDEHSVDGKKAWSLPIYTLVKNE